MGFIKTTFLGGLLVVFPLLLLYLGVMEIAKLLVAMAEPIADLFPRTYFEHLNFPGVVAAVLITLVSFVAGLALRSQFLSNIGRSIEESILDKLPMYSMLKQFSASFIADDKSSFAPAAYKNPDGGLDPCYVIEEGSTGRLTVLFPLSPAAFAGSIQLVSKSEVEYLDCSFDQLSVSVANFGVGMQQCMDKRVSKP